MVAAGARAPRVRLAAARLPVSFHALALRRCPRRIGRFHTSLAMNDLSTRRPLVYKPLTKVRFVTAASLFDGHDASINIMRRILQATGCEVIHLGHNRSVEEIVDCAIQEDAHGIAISSYQGGHVEFFKYMLDLLRERGAGHIKVFGGGGGVIVPSEIEALHDYGVTRIFSPEDGQKLGLQGMINEIVAAADVDLAQTIPQSIGALREGDRYARTRALARAITALEAGVAPPAFRQALLDAAAKAKTPVLGITGTGGAGKSSLTDELVRRFRLDQRDRAEDRDRVDRSVAAQVRRRAARRPHPDERDRHAEHLHALARDARRGQRDLRRRCPTRSPRARRRASTSSSSRPPASARATRRSCRTSTYRCT